MDVKEFLKSELSGWGRYERIIFPVGIFAVILISFFTNDDKIALVSAVCGISYTILAGKGKISCFVIGLCGTLCYAYISYKNGLYGNLALYMLYYFPMQIAGIFKWKKHLDRKTKVIVKTSLQNKERIFYFAAAVLLSAAAAFVLKLMNGANPLFDSVTAVFSVIGLILTVKRCIEQWYIWTIVNGMSVVMWIEAYFAGSNCLATIIMWAVYFVLGIYFLYCWQKEMVRH